MKLDETERVDNEMLGEVIPVRFVATRLKSFVLSKICFFADLVSLIRLHSINVRMQASENKSVWESRLRKKRELLEHVCACVSVGLCLRSVWVCVLGQ